ncbi:nitrate- and nitrite sensing domain-containing protein [Actinomadura sp. ATCC 31491]|uniref:histidine kinase n=1 Tax=Actinomadura luzonensis TaxID=2805427 RepID=A0ABT0FJE7_9ACTN|nr:nitrate- and nitrite sensing domain-containing protein [Actinomadura luzonensis]MCK2212449.1 nitrate- and nitrite sensing domain-containing protein [Actinomadura luzonensis]
MKIIGLLLVPLASMVVLWGVITAVTATESLELREYKTLWTNLRHPAYKLISEIQRERLVSAKLLRHTAGAATVAAQRTRTDAARDTFRQLSSTTKNRSEEIRTQVDAVYTQLDRLDAIRGEIDTGLSDRLHTVEAYNAIIDTVFGLHRHVALIDDIPIYEQSRVVIDLGYAKELLTREQAIALGPVTENERRLFTQIVGNRRFLVDQSLGELDRPLRDANVVLISSPAYQRMRMMEDQIIAGRVPRSWLDTTDALARSFQSSLMQASATLNARAEPVADEVLRRAFMLAGLCLALVVVSIAFSLRMGNRLSKELGSLRLAALEVAQERLPQVVAKLRRGEKVELPELSVPSTTTEIDDVGQAFSTVQQTAVEAAVGQAQLSEGVGHVFRNLARRSQALLHRQRIQLQDMQHRATEPDALEDLFKLDHLTTRMRRHAEGLIILSGATPGRGWSRPVPLLDVARGAAAEVEDYQRVTVEPMPAKRLAGPVVGDVIHLIAELIENATVYSPEKTPVIVRGETAARGFVFEVEDRGFGMSPEELAEYNARLASPPEFDLADSDRLGLFVVSRLAARHDIRVTLRGSPYGGTTAIVLIPEEHVAEPEAPAEEPKRPMRVVRSE